VLQNAGIEVIVDLRGVGDNVQEHNHVLVSYRTSIQYCLVMMMQTEDGHRGEGRVRIRLLDIFNCLRDPDERRKQMEL
jgi:hypothetical protein